METQDCFLLSYLKYGDNDAILNCLGKDNGFFTAFARGIYASKNKKKAYVQVLHFGKGAYYIFFKKVKGKWKIANSGTLWDN